MTLRSIMAALMLCGECFGATYYVRTDGNNSNDGLSNTAGGAWRTIAKAASTLSAGDTALVQSGNYDETVTVTVAGSAGSPVSITGVDWPRTTQFNIAREWVVVSGFDVTSSAALYGNFHTTNSNVSIVGNVIRDTTVGIGAGVQLSKDFGGAALTYDKYPTNISIVGNVFSNLVNHGVVAKMNASVIASNRFDRLPNDAIDLWGDNNVIAWNVATNLADPEEIEHVDFIQTWLSVTGDHATNNTVHGNLAINSDIQFCNLEDGNETNDFNGWTFYNNRAVNLTYSANAGIPFTRWFNNTFYRAPNGSNEIHSVAVIFFNQSGFHSFGGVITNNAFVACGYSNAADGLKLGYYSLASVGTAGHNYVAGLLPGFGTSATFSEGDGVNGGDPLFTDASTGNVRLGIGSPAIDSGMDLSSVFAADASGSVRFFPWDIGAYEYGRTASVGTVNVGTLTITP